MVRLYRTSLTTSLQGKQGVQGAYALVRGGSSACKHFITYKTYIGVLFLLGTNVAHSK